MTRKQIVQCIAAAAVALTLFSAWLWQPARQVRLHTSHLLAAVEGRRWGRMEEFIADNYSDRWGHDKEFVLQGSKEVFGQFLFLTIQSETISSNVPRTAWRDDAKRSSNRAENGTTSFSIPIGVRFTHTRVKIAGSGSPIAQIAVDRVNRLREPFVFTWQKVSWKPWDWRLIHFDQPELNISETLDL